jgi:hypothetical protein
MIIDKQTLMSEDQAVTVTAASTNVIDLASIATGTPTPNELGNYELLLQVTTTFHAGTSMSATVQTDDDESFGSPTSLVASAAIATATLVAGYQYKIALPSDAITERYMRVYYTVVGTMDAGKVTAALVIDRQTNK